MSALAGVLGPSAVTAGAALPAMFAEMRNRASGAPEQFSSPRATIAAARHSWEEDVTGLRGPLLVEAEDWVVAADATLYYLQDLRRRLGQPVAMQPGDCVARFVLRALRKWGDQFARFLEGDYSIIAWERSTGRALLARDFGGRRNLAYSITANGTLVVASSPAAVVTHPDVSSEYDLAFVAVSAVGIVNHGQRSAWRDVAVVPGGATLSVQDGRITEVDRWLPPSFDDGWESRTSPDAARELRSLLEDATRERLASSGPTTVWMSGGWDSTAVFAAGSAKPTGRPVLPVSMFYPADDPGNEQDFIRAVADRWRTPVHWVDAESIPLFQDSDRRAGIRDDPMVQAFESSVRRLSQTSRELGARVVLDGFGGDHIFHVSSGGIIADHVFHGRWSHVVREWRQWPGERYEFYRACVLPQLAQAVRSWIGSVRGRPMGGYWDRTLPPWIVATREVVSQLSPELEPEPGEGAAEYESRVAILTPFVARAISWNHAIGLDEGVEIRSPLFDNRVIAFAAARPLSDRGGGGDSKRILRASMAGLLPDSVLAVRTHKTGTPVGYFRRQLQATLGTEVAKVFGNRRSELERLGVLDRKALESATEQYLGSGIHAVGALLHLTLECERWLVSRRY